VGLLTKGLPVLAFTCAAIVAFSASLLAFAPMPRAAVAAPHEVTPITTEPSPSGLAEQIASPVVPAELPLESVPAAETLSPTPTATPSPSPTTAPARAQAVVLRVPVLMYHYISAVPASQMGDRFAVDLRVPPDLFEQHLAYLRDQGYATISAPMLWEALNGRATLPAKPVVLTFDDGYLDAYTNAFPLLRKYGFTGTFFITCNLIGRPGYMSWDQVRELDAGGMDIESHAMDHRPMSSFGMSGLAYQMGQARATLAQRLGHEVRFFAYPSGDYNATALQGVAANGYAAAFVKGGGSAQSLDWRYTLRRARVGGYATVDVLKSALRY
jgi:peptidoglycan/xylan/chitin deacetylase (PgdA/CDA1 family)